ncbi:hypothetical protein QBZ16_003005 [Prototheca wickerhamii]|uniref:DNA mismatch repair proteins mutS family domain-containing protein n=1 Tax=Prototheca wickerhamii TaxID=3111 RepID=A0AAD9ILG4_PROWI|nr:hypothetical protein QBZ16_003005 [Prototheca wickerhamii]
MSEQVPSLDVSGAEHDAFSSWFASLPDTANLVRLFDRKSCVSVHGPAALVLAQQLYGSTSKARPAGGDVEGLPFVTLSWALLPSALRFLLVDPGEHSVELYEGSGTNWTVAKRGSPGLLRDFEGELARAGDAGEGSALAAVTLGNLEGLRTVGIASVDPASHTLLAAEFADDDRFCVLESALLQLGVRRVLRGPRRGRRRRGPAPGRARALRRGRGPAPARAFATKNLDLDLQRLLAPGTLEQQRHVVEGRHASAAVAGLLGFAELLADAAGHGRYALRPLDLGRFMRLDAAAQRALSVTRERAGAGGSSAAAGPASAASFSLFGLLDRCRTAMGKRLLRRWLKQPLLDLEELRGRHDVVEALVHDIELRQALRDLHLRGVPDLEVLGRKLERQRATLSDLCQMYRASSRLPLICQALRAHEGPHAELLVNRFATELERAHDSEHLARFEALLETAVDLDRIPDEYLIAPGYDAGLQEVESEKVELEARIKQLAEEAAADLGLILDKSIKLEWHKFSNQRLRCLRITAKEEKLVRKKLQAKYLELETRKDGIKFTNKPLKAAAERLQALSCEYDSRQAALVAQVVSVAATFCPVWEGVRGVLAELDVLASFADVAASAPSPYVRPVMLPRDGAELVLEACRHPCVELQEGVDFVPNDCRMVRGESWFQLITGPNMGGKSTFIRQVGIAVLLAQVGSWVPCARAVIPARDAIFARVGAGDSQARGVSTFMAEMLESAAILKGASAASLVIVDELGRGTSTWDGMALAWAISEHLMDAVGCPTLFATHFHELTALRGGVGVKNLHVNAAIDPASGAVTMLHQVKEGSSDKSFGIHVAEYARFPASVVEKAKSNAAAAAAARIGADERDGKRQRVEQDAAIESALLEFTNLPLSGSDAQEAADALASWRARAQSLLAA